jgi:hypothetical protein
VKFEILTAVTLKIIFVWDIMNAVWYRTANVSDGPAASIFREKE